MRDGRIKEKKWEMEEGRWEMGDGKDFESTISLK
jgi:hypothetical protein